MLNSTVRAIAFGFGLLSFVIGALLVVSHTSEAISGLWPLVFGAVIMVVVVMERNRYRSEVAERNGGKPGPGGGETGRVDPRFIATTEVFVDPTSGTRMRVWVDPRTGERRYHAETR